MKREKFEASSKRPGRIYSEQKVGIMGEGKSRAGCSCKIMHDWVNEANGKNSSAENSVGLNWDYSTRCCMIYLTGEFAFKTFRTRRIAKRGSRK